MLLRGSRPGHLFCTADGKPVSRHDLTTVHKDTLKLLKLPQSNYKLHSFRIGAATAALLR